LRRPPIATDHSSGLLAVAARAWLLERCTIDLAAGTVGTERLSEPRGFVSEPVMVPRPAPAGGPDPAKSEPAEDDGWVLCMVWNGARCASDLVILAAASMQELAVVELPLAIPYGLHGSFVAA
jgi:all-trans-8'-apo-beta-carotenal 15,15'-oxygenase